MENTAQIHTHSDTCFKYLPKTLKNLRDNDKDRRFKLPREKTKEMHLDKNGSMVSKYNNGAVNGYNPTIVTTMRCNMDAKLMGSGTTAMAMYSYVGNCVIKMSVDTGSIHVFGTVHWHQDDIGERSRLLMVKTVNQLIGKRELSGQQVATDLMNWPRKYTNRKYPKFNWSQMLREFASQSSSQEKINRQMRQSKETHQH
ncbi:hypothetical protein K438DRAFT_1562955 [Mycena galopus ATCC 62051]|nr:hypothetical protein K438DRAFT_1562429 [Mycena galopus ATCC 62051]KAF8214412.1 hypothetical protein K438DRAFT_1562955 [Mycena galopus ATCC 62051]